MHATGTASTSSQTIWVPKLMALACTHLPVVQETDNHGSSADISRRGGQQPMEVRVGGNCSVHNRSKNFTAARNAVREPSHANHEGQQVDDSELADSPMTGSDN